MNPMLQQLFNSRLTQAVGQVRQIMMPIRMAQNPMLGLRQMAKTSPLAKQAVQIIEQNGGDENAAFANQAKAFGLDPQQILSMINGV